MSEANRHPLRGLLTAQFFGAFNDNAWKIVVVLLGIRAVAAGADSAGAAKQEVATIATLVLLLPLCLLSLPGGILANRISKRSVIVALKGVETALMLAGTLVLLFAPSQQILLLVVLGGMGVQSALFGPAKYGILPEILDHERLSRGNGLLELWSFSAIVLGTAVGGFLLEQSGGQLWFVGALLTFLAGVGWFAARSIPPVPPACREKQFGESIVAAWRSIRGQRVLWLTVLGSTLFWSVAMLVGQEVLVYTENTLGQPESTASVPLAVLSIGVGIGSVISGRLSGDKVEYGLIPFGAAGLAGSLILFGIVEPGIAGTIAFMIPVGLFSGFVLVPLNSLLQWRSPSECRGGVIAIANAIAFAGMIAGTLAARALAGWGLTETQGIAAAGALTALGTMWALWLLPDAFLRFLLILLTHSLYRLKVIGRVNVPGDGGALLVPNHVSFADGLFLIASVDRPIRFIVDANYFHHPLLKPFMKSLGAIPISTAGGPRVVLRALRAAGDYLDRGHLVCIFAEGQITRTGMLLPFRRGLERIVKGRKAPLIPVHLDGVWGSVFSHAGGRFMTKIPKRIPYPVTVTFGESLPAGTPVFDVRKAVQDLSVVAWGARQDERRPLHHSFVRRCRRRPFNLLFADASRPRVSRFAGLTGAIALARALREKWRGQETVGILLPSSVGGATVNLAAAFAGRTSVNLNFTSGASSFASAVQQSDLRTIVSHREFVEKLGIEIPSSVETIWIEDISARIGTVSRCVASLLALAAPVRFIERACGAERRIVARDTATIIFSSGSTGEPKGVMLSHANVDANVEGVAQVTRVDEHDRLLGVLPLFHSFGYMALWFAANRDLGTIFHPNPLDAGKVGELTHRYNVTLLIATPTFLQLYLRRCTPAQFGSLRIVLCGAEKLSDRLAAAFEERFGIRPLEGYGATECSPAITVSALDYRAPGFYQPGSRRGSVGQPLPGVAVRIVNPDTGEALAANEPGLILVRGPNVMQGYLKRPELTAEAMRDGWYVTGDIGTIDDDGFLRITDRLSRFSKIGGEMVPHGKVEESLQTAAGEELQVFAVTSVSDEKKGERLAVLHTIEEERIPEILSALQCEGLPNLFIPKVEQFVRVEELPVLGTGKLDLRAVKNIASETFTRATST